LAALTDATIELIIAGMSSGDVERLKARMQERLPVDADGVSPTLHARTR
jgi:hypothetical protein